MKFKQYLIEIIDLDKSLKDITKPNNITWVFYVNDVKFRIYITDMGIIINDQYVKAYEIMLEMWNGVKWVNNYISSNINAGVLGGKIISIVYDILIRLKLKAFIIRSYHPKLERLYDMIWTKYDKTLPFRQYTRYYKRIGNIKQYSYMKTPNIQEDNYMMKNYMELNLFNEI